MLLLIVLIVRLGRAVAAILAERSCGATAVRFCACASERSGARRQMRGASVLFFVRRWRLECAYGLVVLMSIRRVERGHRRIFRWAVCIFRLKVVRVSADRAAGWSTGTHGGLVVIIVEGNSGQGRLGKRLSDEFSFPVLEMRVVACSFLLGQSCSLSKTLLVPALDNLGDAFVDFVAAVFLKSEARSQPVWVEGIMNERRTFRLP